MLTTWFKFGGNLLEMAGVFFLQFRMCFFKVKISIGHILAKVSLTDVKRKGSALVGYWVKYVTLNFDLTHDPDLGFFKVRFWNSCTSGIVNLIGVKWKGSKSIRYWVDYLTLPFDHTHDLDLELSRSKFEIASFMTVTMSFGWPWWGG